MIAIVVEALALITGRMILQIPNYFGWSHYAQLRKLSVVSVKFGQSKIHTFCIEDFLRSLQSNPSSLVVISNPNSPTGFLFNAEEMIKISEVSKKNNHLLVIDECFSGFSKLNHYKILDDHEHIIFIRSFSKCYGLAGSRIALTIASKKITQYLSRWRPDSGVSGPALQILEKLVGFDEQLQKICDDIIYSREKFVTELKKLFPEWKAIPSGGNYVNFFLGNEVNPLKLIDHLYQRGFHLRDVSKFTGMESCVRFGIMHWSLMENVVTALREIKEAVNLKSDN